MMLNKKRPYFLLPFVLITALTVFIAGESKAAKLIISPAEQNVFNGDILRVDIVLDTEEELLNSGEIILDYDKNFLEPLEITKGNSIFSLWIEEPSFTGGQIKFKGGKPNGFFSNYAFIGQVVFRALQTGATTLSFNSDSKVLKHDGLGTLAEVKSEPANYKILELLDNLPKLVSKSHPESGRWYPKRTFYVNWDAKEDILYSYLISQDITAKADDGPNEPVGDLKFAGLTNGVWYFTLRQKLPEETDWSTAVRYLVLNDIAPPKDFIAKASRDDSAFQGKYFLSFTATDSISGIAHYEVKEGDGGFVRAVSPYILKNQKRSVPIIVKAVDEAGNAVTASIAPIEKPLSKYYIFGVMILALLIVFVLWFIIRKKQIKNLDF